MKSTVSAFNYEIRDHYHLVTKTVEIFLKFYVRFRFFFIDLKESS